MDVDFFEMLQHVLSVGKSRLLCRSWQLARRTTPTVDHRATLVLNKVHIVANMLTRRYCRIADFHLGLIHKRIFDRCVVILWSEWNCEFVEDVLIAARKLVLQ